MHVTSIDKREFRNVLCLGNIRNKKLQTVLIKCCHWKYIRLKVNAGWQILLWFALKQYESKSIKALWCPSIEVIIHFILLTLRLSNTRIILDNSSHFLVSFFKFKVAIIPSKSFLNQIVIIVIPYYRLNGWLSYGWLYKIQQISWQFNYQFWCIRHF